jgi:hypothetical protein
MWLYILPVDALEVVRTSALKVAKAAQAVAKFFLQVLSPWPVSHACVGLAALLPLQTVDALNAPITRATVPDMPATPACVQMCNNVVRHRLTLQLRAGRAWRRTKERLLAVALAPWRLLGRLLGELLKWMLVAIKQV